MKTILIAVLLVALPAFGEDKTEKTIREGYEAWLPAHKAELSQAMFTILCDPACHVGDKASNPERKDPIYLSWKGLREKQYGADAFERSWDPDKYKHVNSSEFRQWIAENLEVKGNVSSLSNGPPPEEWIPDRVNSSGQAVDKHGEVSIQAVTQNNSTGLVYFWIPLGIGLLVSILMAKSGHPTIGFCLGYFGYGFLVGGTTGLKVVTLELASAYVIVLVVFVVGVKLALSGLGVTKGN